MATVTAYTAARSLQIENSSVTSGAVDANGNLILTTRGGTPINAGYVVGPAGTPVGSIEQTVKNSSGVAIAKGNVVYISGALDGTALIAKAQANSDATSSKVLGLASEAINNGATGKVMTEGVLTGLDTSAATDGATVWLSATVPGGFVYGDANRPLAPNHSVYVGKVLEAHATLGSIYIRIDNGDQINELHDVTVSSPAATHVLARNSANTLWQNRALAANDIPNLESLNGTLDVANGGTGATTVAAAQAALGVKVVQVLHAYVDTAIVNNSSTYVDTGATVTITPTLSTSKILIFAIQPGAIKNPGNANSALNVRLLRNATVLETFVSVGFTGVSSDNRFGSADFAFMDSPATTSAITYKTQIANNYNGVGVGIARAMIVVMEIKA